MKNLSHAEIEKAISIDPKTYPQDMPCSVCGFRWMQHMGTLCPVRPGYIENASGFPKLVLPVFGNTTFLPDLDYYKTPDFDVV